MVSMKRGGMRLGLLSSGIGVGGVFVYRWLSKLIDGPEKREVLGRALSVFGIKLWANFFGFLATFIECAGGIYLIAGVFFILACGLMTFMMVVAATMYLTEGAEWGNVLFSADGINDFKDLVSRRAEPLKAGDVK